MIGQSLETQKIKLFDIMNCDDVETEKYHIWMRQYMKLYKAIFHKYATVSSNKSKKQLTFDEMKDQTSTMNIAEVYLFLNDFKIT